MEIKIVDLDGITEQELLKVIGDNVRVAQMMKSKIRELKKIQTQSNELPNNKSNDEKNNEVFDTLDVVYKEDAVKVNASFEDEVNYYLAGISQVLEEELDEKLESFLPSKSHYRYKEIILRLKLESLKNIKEIKELLVAEDGNISSEDMREFKDEILLEQKKIALLTSISNTKDAKKEEQVIKNRFVFATRSGGNIRVLEELNRISSEYYPSFLGLFNSIKNGTFKDVKRLNSNPEVAGFCEVRDLSANTRVVFDRIGENTYVLITAFIKKSESCDNGYMDSLKKKINTYKSYSLQMKENLGNSEFMELQHEYENELYRKLGSTSKGKGTKKVKRL